VKTSRTKELALKILNNAIEKGATEHAALMLVKTVDPFVRSSVRRHIMSTVMLARTESTSTDEAHLLRLAWLRLLGVHPPDPKDVNGVTQIFLAANPKTFEGTRNWAESIVGICIGSACVAAALLVVFRINEPSRAIPNTTDVRKEDKTTPVLPSVPAGLLTVNGVAPPLTADMRLLFKEQIPRIMGVLDSYAASPSDWVQTLESQIKSAEQTAARIGKDVHSKLHEFLKRSQQVVDFDVAGLGSVSEMFINDLRAFNEFLHANDIAIFLYGYVDQSYDNVHVPVVMTFEVTEVRQVTYDGHSKFPVILVHRLDEQEYDVSSIGFSHVGSSVAYVVLEQIEAKIGDQILPVLKSDAAYAYMGDDAKWSGIADIQNLAGKKLRENLLRNAEDGSRIGDLAAKRQNVIRSIEKRISIWSTGRYLNHGCEVRPEFFADLSKRGANSKALSALRQVDEELGLVDDRALADKAFGIEVDNTVRHVAQFVVDRKSGPLAVPEAFGNLAGRSADPGELSGYLAAIADGPVGGTTQMLVDLAELLYARQDRWGNAFWGAIVIFEGLTDGRHALWPGDEKLDQQAAADAIVELLEQDSATVRGNAASLWQKLFGRPLPRVTHVRP
jgi:hypothetical protein